MRRRLLIWTSLWLVAAPRARSRPVPSGGSSSTAVDPMFNQAVLHDVRLVMDPADGQALRDNFRENQYYAANVTIDNEIVRQVGIRSRGSGSRNEVKPGLKLDFNKPVKDQEFHGYKSLVLDNMVQDASMVRERLACAERLTVNDQYWGVYALIESITKPFLKKRLGNDTGNLFDYEYAFHWDFTFLGPAPEEYTPVPFPPETNEDHVDAQPLVDFVRTANDAPDATFPADIARYLDVDSVPDLCRGGERAGRTRRVQPDSQRGASDTKKPFDNATFEDAVRGLRGSIAAREGDIAAQTR